MRSSRSSCRSGAWRCRRAWSPSGWSRKAPRSRAARRSSTSRPRRSPTSTRARSRGRCAAGWSARARPCRSARCSAWSPMPRCRMPSSTPSSPSSRRSSRPHAAEAGAAAPEPETIEAGGRRFRYLTLGEGEGPPIVFIHGFGGDLNNWLFNQEALAESHATYALDLPGHGGSSKDLGAGHVHVGALATAVLDFLDAKEIDKAHLVGHSLGGAIALDLALNHAERVASVTLICSAGLGPDINMDYIDGFMQAKRRKQLQPVLEMLVADPALVSREMIEDVLKFKRLDGVEAALNRIIDDSLRGRPAGARPDRPARRAERAGAGDLGPPGPDHAGEPRRGPAGQRPGPRLRRRRPHGAHGEGGRGQRADPVAGRRLTPPAPDRRRGAMPRRFRSSRACGAPFRPSISKASESALEPGEGTMTSSARPIPEGYHSVTPYLIVSDAAGAIAFYKEAFGAAEVMRMAAPGGRVGHAELKIGDSRIMLADDSRTWAHAAPRRSAVRRSSLHLYVEDVDAVAKRAVSAGAKEVAASQGPVLRRPAGQRRGPLRPSLAHLDPHGGRAAGRVQAPRRGGDGTGQQLTCPLERGPQMEGFRPRQVLVSEARERAAAAGVLDARSRRAPGRGSRSGS